METIVEVRVEPGQSVAFEAPLGGAFKHIYMFAKIDGGSYKDVPAVEPVEGDQILGMVNLRALMVDGDPIFKSRSPDGGSVDLPGIIFQPRMHAMDFEARPDWKWTPASRISGEIYAPVFGQGPITAKIVFRDEGYAIGPPPFQALDPAFPVLETRENPPGKRPREYITGISPEPIIESGQTVEVSFSKALSTYKPRRLMIPSRIAEGFVIHDIKIGGESRLRGQPATPQPATDFSELVMSPQLDLGECSAGSAITFVVENTG